MTALVSELWMIPLVFGALRLTDFAVPVPTAQPEIRQRLTWYSRGKAASCVEYQLFVLRHDGSVYSASLPDRRSSHFLLENTSRTDYLVYDRSDSRRSGSPIPDGALSTLPGQSRVLLDI